MRKAALAKISVAMSSLIALLVFPGTPGYAKEDKDFGCTVRYNIETQVVNMNPQYQGSLIEGGNGQRSAAAVNRYMNGKVRPLVGMSGTTEVGGQGGASSSGGGN